jgi:hypothetical protein
MSDILEKILATKREELPAWLGRRRNRVRAAAAARRAISGACALSSPAGSPRRKSRRSPSKGGSA